MSALTLSYLDEILGYDNFSNPINDLIFGAILFLNMLVYLKLIKVANYKINQMKNEINYMSYCVLSYYLLRSV